MSRQPLGEKEIEKRVEVTYYKPPKEKPPPPPPQPPQPPQPPRQIPTLAILGTIAIVSAIIGMEALRA